MACVDTPSARTHYVLGRSLLLARMAGHLAPKKYLILHSIHRNETVLDGGDNLILFRAVVEFKIEANDTHPLKSATRS